MESHSIRSNGTIDGIRYLFPDSRGERPTDLRAGKPRRDLAESLRIEEVDNAPMVDVVLPNGDQSGLLQDPELP